MQYAGDCIIYTACMRSSHGLLLACMRKLLVEELEPAANIYAHVWMPISPSVDPY